MTQNYENGSSRLDRIEAIILELATANIRHENQFNRYDNQLNRHDEQFNRHNEQFNRHNEQFSRINATLERISEQQAINARLIEANTRQGALNQEGIQNLMASIQELRNMVADYMQGRSQL